MARPLFCQKHQIYYDFDEELKRAPKFCGVPMGSVCPECRAERGARQRKIVFAAIAFIFVGLFYKLPKIIYEKSGGGTKGKRNVILYFSGWVLAIIVCIICVNISSHIESKRIATQYFKSAYAKEDIETMRNNIAEADISDINLSNDIETCLSKSSKEGKCTDKIQLLLEHGKKADEKNASGKTPLLISASYGSHLMAETLLKNKADVNLAFKNGNAPLHFAVASGNLNLVKLLVEKGANKNAKNNKGQTPFDIAIDNDIKEYLKKSQ